MFAAIAAPACDLGDLNLDPAAAGQGRLPLAHVTRRVELGLDGNYQMCGGTLRRWDADVDLVDAALATHADEGRVHLFLYNDPAGILDACDNETGCYHKRPPGPETIENLSEQSGEAIYWFAFERLETQWSAELPEFVRHGIGDAITDRSCLRTPRPLNEVLLVSDSTGLDLGQARATGQWIRMLWKDFGVAPFEVFARKLDSASSPSFVRAVFAQVYGLNMDATWERARTESTLPPPGGWCRAPAMPPISSAANSGEGGFAVKGELACENSFTEGHFNGFLQRSLSFTLDTAAEVEVQGEVGEDAQLFVDGCNCSFSPSYELEIGDLRILEAGTYRLRIRSRTRVYEIAPPQGETGDSEEFGTATGLDGSADGGLDGGLDAGAEPQAFDYDLRLVTTEI